MAGQGKLADRVLVPRRNPTRSCKQGIIIREFTKFAKLPPELRLAIWDEYIKQPPTIACKLVDGSTENRIEICAPTPDLWGGYPALPSHQPVSFSLSLGFQPSLPIPFNFDIDKILCVNGFETMRIFPNTGPGPAPAAYMVKHIIVRNAFVPVYLPPLSHLVDMEIHVSKGWWRRHWTKRVIGLWEAGLLEFWNDRGEEQLMLSLPQIRYFKENDG